MFSRLACSRRWIRWCLVKGLWFRSILRLRWRRRSVELRLSRVRSSVRCLQVIDKVARLPRPCVLWPSPRVRLGVGRECECWDLSPVVSHPEPPRAIAKKSKAAMLAQMPFFCSPSSLTKADQMKSRLIYLRITSTKRWSKSLGSLRLLCVRPIRKNGLFTDK